MNAQATTSNTLTYPVMMLATGGDVDAINAVLKHYEGYIAALATRKLYDEQGNFYSCVGVSIKAAA